MMKKCLLFLGLVVMSVISLFSQERMRGDYRIMFYNVENLFDYKDEPNKEDNAFTPEGDMHWSFTKYKKKINRISQVIMAVGGWEVPELVGLCEVENHYVLDGLTRYTALSKYRYKYIHYDSPDERGIDVALLYQEKKFEPIHSEPIEIHLDSKENDTTRDILYVKGITHTEDTLHIFINHWPSNYGGVLEAIPKRTKVAEILKMKTDSIFSNNPLAKIVIMGDFNTEPTQKPMIETLGAKVEWNGFGEIGLYNISALWSKQGGKGSYKFRGVWSIIDQFIISNGMAKGEGILFCKGEDAKIYKAPFLLELDKEGGYKPFRTNIGMRYNDGFSDHLPIYLDLWRE